jgi:hypothetical protein
MRRPDQARMPGDDRRGGSYGGDPWGDRDEERRLEVLRRAAGARRTAAKAEKAPYQLGDSYKKDGSGDPGRPKQVRTATPSAPKSRLPKMAEERLRKG